MDRPSFAARSAIAIALLTVTIGLATASSIWIKTPLGLSRNWPWPFISSGAAVLFARRTGTRWKFLPQGRAMAVRALGIGVFVGVVIQLPSFANGTRLQRYSGATPGELVFQMLTSSAEELLFRGVLVPYLAAAIPLRTMRRSWLASGLLTSIPFALLHGLHPVLVQGGHFNIAWAETTFAFSVIASVLYAYVPFVVAPAAAHTVSNFAYELF